MTKKISDFTVRNHSTVTIRFRVDDISVRLIYEYGAESPVRVEMHGSWNGEGVSATIDRTYTPQDYTPQGSKYALSCFDGDFNETVAGIVSQIWDNYSVPADITLPEGSTVSEINQ